MKLNNLINILRGGNLALGQKLQNLLTEDCTILEYTDDAVLFHKNNHLVLAKFKHNLAESKLSADDVIDNEILYVSGIETEKNLKSSILSIVDGLVESDYVSAEAELASFCEQYYQYSFLKQRYPELFQENITKKSKGLPVRKKASTYVSSFRSEIFNLATINESVMESADYISVLETSGMVLALGKKKVLSIVTDALLGNEELAENITSRLYDTALTLSEANEDLMGLVSAKYDIESGKFEDEDAKEVEKEDLDADLDSIDSEFPEEETDESSSDFVEFDPSKLSDEEIKNLHVDILKSFLEAMKEFVDRESNNPENTEMEGDLDEKLALDLEKLLDSEVSDEELSRIEADWQPVLSFFLDSDLYKSDQEEGEDISLDDIVDGGEDSETADFEEAGEEELSEPEELEGLEGAEEEEEELSPAKPSLKV